ncbi:MAG: hypothetical protein ACXV2C_07680 [Candidatus Bathyarchaeia archaeon]
MRILEVGSGIGTMIERLLNSGLLENAIYTAIEARKENKIHASERLQTWASSHDHRFVEVSPDDWELLGTNRRIEMLFKNEDFFDFASRERDKWDLIIANAFLDLVNNPVALYLMGKLLEKGSIFYFTINFDGMTILEPVIDKEIDELILKQYHRTMDERLVNGMCSGDSLAGRHLFTYLKEVGMQILNSGASDWVIFAKQNGYTQDEAYFLHFMLHNIQEALENNAELDAGLLNDWISKRHDQVENNELIYIAHQIDFVGIC